MKENLIAKLSEIYKKGVIIKSCYSGNIGTIINESIHRSDIDEYMVETNRGGLVIYRNGMYSEIISTPKKKKLFKYFL